MAPKKAPPPPAPAAEAGVEAEAAPEEPPPREPPRDPHRGSIGHLLQDAFKDLYQPPAAAREGEQDAGGGSAAAAARAAAEARAVEAVDTKKEDEEIASIHTQIEAERARIEALSEQLTTKGQEAVELDRQQAAQLQKRWGLVMREQFPVPESKLKDLLEPEGMAEEGLLIPREMMEDVEVAIEYNKGTIPRHDNLLGKSRPAQAGYLKQTTGNTLRSQLRNVQPTLTPAQKAHIHEAMSEKQRTQLRKPTTMDPDEVLKNREIARKMAVRVNFKKNPRSLADRKAAERGEPCPFAALPEAVVFQNYEAGAVYQIDVEFRNVTKVGRSLRVIPPKGGSFCAEPLRYEGANPTTAMIAPGMAAHVLVRFAPATLNDISDEMTVCTEFGDYTLPVAARRQQPRLQFASPVDCGRILAGSTHKVITRVFNLGGEGSFRLIPGQAEDGPEVHYSTPEGGETSLVSDRFRVAPASFYLEAGASVDLTASFSSSEVGEHSLNLKIECDSGALVPLTLTGIADALRLELARWPGLPGPVAPRAPPPGVSPWSLVPWRLNWTTPGTQVGSSSSQTIVIANGGNLPAPVEWSLAKVPRKVASRLVVGSQQRLTEDIFAEMPRWTVWPEGLHGSERCPFKVSPQSTTIAPFSTATFTFEFQAYAPVGGRAINLACLQAKGLPDKKDCLLPYGRLLHLQDSMARPAGYVPGLPLAGGAVFAPEDTPQDDLGLATPGPDASGCIVTAVCLQGMSVAPAVSCLPKSIIMSGDVLPFVSHTRTVRLRNAGPTPCCFRVRLSSSEPQKGQADMYGALWVVSAAEAGPKPEEPPAPPEDGASPEERREFHAQRLSAMWPPLPPEGPESTMQPGYGAVATAAVEPSEGSIQPGGFVDLRVSLRVLKEVDLNAHFVVELPVALSDKEPAQAAPPLRVAVVGAVRSPQVELRRTSMLDYGVVRAHSRQTRQLRLSNPSELPVLLRLRHLRGEAPADLAAAPGAASSSASPAKLEPAAEAHFPLHTHQQVVDFFAQAVSQGHGGDAFQAVPGEPREVPAPPWVHSRDGCMDNSGRRVFSEGRAFRGRKTCFQGETSNGEVDREARVDDSDDFVFTPSCLVLWPHESAEVDVLLRTAAEGKYRALLEAVGFDSLQPQCVEVWAEVQLPSVRVSTQHVHFPKSYLNVATSAYQLELKNMSDLPANFRWEVPMNFGSGLEVQIGPSQGTVPPRSTFTVALVATPTRKGAGAEVQCKLYVQDILSALVVRVSANVYGCQVDYAVAPVGVAMPQICHQPRELDATPSGTAPVLAGPAQPGMPLVDFGTMELLKSRSLQLTLYNRTAIATPFSLKVAKFKAYDPLEKGKCIGDLLDAATRLHALGAAAGAEAGGAEEKLTFSSQPEPAAQGRRESTLQPTQRMKFEPKSRRTLGKSGTMRRKQQKWLLDDKHEKQTFRSSVGEAFANQKEQREAGVVALKLGRGWAVKVDPATDWLQPFSSTVVTLTCYSDLPGEMEDELIVKIQQMEEHSSGSNHFRIPIRLKSFGNPLYIPQQQVGVNYEPPGELDPPQLLCGVMTPIERLVTRSFKVGNHSSVKMRIGWNVLPKKQVETITSDRQLVRVALCKKSNCPEDPFCAALEADGASATEEDAAADEAAALVPPPFEFDMWAQDPPEVQDPFALQNVVSELPVRVEPAEAVVPAYGTATFTVTMTATKTTASAEGHYRYRLVGKGRFTADREAVLAATEEANSPRGSPRLLTGAVSSPAEASAASERTLKRVAPAATAKDFAPTGARSEVLDLPSAPVERGGDDDTSDSDAEPAAARRRSTGTVQVLPLTLEAATPAASAAQAGGGGRLRKYEPAAKLSEEPDGDVLSTIVVEAVGDCILPRLTVDKKADPVQQDFPVDDPDGDGIPGACPVFKFTHSTAAPLLEDGQPAKGRAGGATLAGAPGGAQVAGTLTNTVRKVNLSNRNACSVTCKVRAEGPFRVRQVDQSGQHPVKPRKDGTKREAAKPSVDPDILYVVPKTESVTLTVEFLPELVGQPDVLNREQVSRGNLVIEYPRDQTAASIMSEAGGSARASCGWSTSTARSSDMQRVHLQGVIQRPVVSLFLVPCHLDRPDVPHHAARPSWGEPEVVHVDFGCVHVEGGVVAKRRLLISSESGVIARWHLVHVGRKRRAVADIGHTSREEEEHRAHDDKDVFEFDVCEGELHGPSRGGRDVETGQFVPHYCPRGKELHRPIPQEDRTYEPQEVIVSFKPSKNELYKCRFRIQVEAGPTVDFVCRGCGSYDEEDDVIDFQES